MRTTADLVSKYVGETEQQLAALFDGLRPADSAVLPADDREPVRLPSAAGSGKAW